VWDDVKLRRIYIYRVAEGCAETVKAQEPSGSTAAKEEHRGVRSSYTQVIDKPIAFMAGWEHIGVAI